MALYGTDVSHWNGNINFSKLRQTKYHDFMIIKATQGMRYIDPKFADNMRHAKSAGMLRGAYHYLDTSDPVSQARHFIRNVFEFAEESDVILALDVEDSSLDTMKTSTLAEYVEDFRMEILAQFQTHIVIYMAYRQYPYIFSETGKYCAGWLASRGKDDTPHRKDLNTTIWQEGVVELYEGGTFDVNTAYLTRDGWRRIAHPDRY